MPRRDFSKVAFAATGDVNTIPSTVQPDGSVSLPSGWGFDYQRDNGAGGGTPDPLAKNIDREDMNGILNEITASIGEVQQNGYPIWVSTAAPYPINAYVRFNDIVWRNTVSNNSEQPGAVGVTSWANTANKPNTPSMTVLSGSGNYTVPAGVSRLKIRLWAGGGGGGGVGSTGNGSAGGGGSGGYSETYLTVTPGQVISYVCGAGGTAGGAGGSGGNGGSSNFGTFASATGGAGGGPNSSAGGPGGAGGIGSLGLLNISGGSGSTGAALNAAGGAGASAPGGGGGGGGGAVGQPGGGTTPAGGGGGRGPSSTGSGGAGAPGIIVLEYLNV